MLEIDTQRSRKGGGGGLFACAWGGGERASIRKLRFGHGTCSRASKQFHLNIHGAHMLVFDWMPGLPNKLLTSYFNKDGVQRESRAGTLQRSS